MEGNVSSNASSSVFANSKHSLSEADTTVYDATCDNDPCRETTSSM